jgi:hypothetical protein
VHRCLRQGDGQVGRPRGLIDYATLDDARPKAGGAADPCMEALLRPRTLIYFGVWAAIGAGLLFAARHAHPHRLTVAQGSQPALHADEATARCATPTPCKLRNMEARPRDMAWRWMACPRRGDVDRRHAGANAPPALEFAVPADETETGAHLCRRACRHAAQDFAFNLLALDERARKRRGRNTL